MNSCVIYGRLGKDGEFIRTQSGQGMLKFSVANETGYGDKKKTNWFDCVKFGDSGEKLEQYLLKGAPVVVRGEITLNTWKSNEGVEHSKLSLNVDKVSLVGSKSDNEPKSSRKSSEPVGESISFDDDDIPF